MSEETFAAAKASGLTRDSVEQLAESVARQLDFTPGGDLKAVLQKLGGEVSYKDFWDEETDSGSTEIQGEGKFQIFLSRDTSVTRDRFTIAHELGHYVLHFLWPLKKGRPTGPVRASRYGSDRTEWEANWFAAAFLMPRDQFKEAFKDAGGDLTQVASKFGVSMMAAKIRAEALDLMADDEL